MALTTTVPRCVNESQTTCVTAPRITAADANASARSVMSWSDGANRVRQFSGSNAIVGCSSTRTNSSHRPMLTGQQNQNRPGEAVRLDAAELSGQEIGEVRRHAADHQRGEGQWEFCEAAQRYDRGGV